MVIEVGQRQPYLEVLSLLGRAQAVMVIGSTEQHYTASKIFQAMHSQRPILALLRASSTAVDMLRGVPGVELIAFQGVAELRNRSAAVADALERLATASTTEGARHDSAMLESYSSFNMTQRLTEVFRAVLASAARPQKKRGPRGNRGNGE